MNRLVLFFSSEAENAGLQKDQRSHLKSVARDISSLTDHALLRQKVSDFELEWWPGSKVLYHGAAAHWTCAVLIEAITAACACPRIIGPHDST